MEQAIIKKYEAQMENVSEGGIISLELAKRAVQRAVKEMNKENKRYG